MYMLERTDSQESGGSMASAGSGSSLVPKRRQSVFARIKNKIKSASSSATDLSSQHADGGFDLVRSKTYSGSTAALDSATIGSEDGKTLMGLATVGSSNSPSLLPKLTFTPVSTFDCNMRYQTSDFLARITIGADGLQVSRASQGGDISLEDVEHTSFTVTFLEISRIEEESRTLLTIWTEAGSSLLCSAFTVDFETAYYSVVTPWNRVKSVGLVQDDVITHASDSTELVCECGKRHPGRLILTAEANCIPPIGVYTALFTEKDSQYSIWNGTSKLFKSVGCDEKGQVHFMMDEEIFGDLAKTREYQFKASKKVECPDHVLIYCRLETLVRSFEIPVTSRIYICALRKEEERGLRIRVYLATASTQFPLINAKARDLLEPILITWIERSVDRLIEALPDEEEVDARMLIETPTTWKCVVKALIGFRLCPWLSAQLAAIASFRLFKYKEAILAVFLSASIMYAAVIFAWRWRPCIPGFVPIEERFGEYSLQQDLEYKSLVKRLRTQTKALKNRLKTL